MLNFTVGPVQSGEIVRSIGSEQVPYFRTSEFSELMFENERLIKKFVKTSEDSRVCFMTCSGTGAMEATVANCFTKDDNLIVIDGGSFGHRFDELAKIYEIPHTTIHLKYGQALKPEHLAPYEGQNYTGLLVNVHETSTGVHYDIEMIAEFCKRNDIFLVVDAISSFLCDDFNMQKLGAAVMITGSQKALACPPGISLVVLSPKAVERIYQNKPVCMYFDLKLALKNGERGQTPFTPAVGILRQIHARLKQIDETGGVDMEIKRCADIAEDFRSRIKHLPLEIISECMSNAVTPLHPLNVPAYDVFTILKDEYHIWVCPNGGDMATKIFRVGHIGNLTKEDNTTLINAFESLLKRGLL